MASFHHPMSKTPFRLAPKCDFPSLWTYMFSSTYSSFSTSFSKLSHPNQTSQKIQIHVLRMQSSLESKVLENVRMSVMRLHPFCTIKSLPIFPRSRSGYKRYALDMRSRSRYEPHSSGWSLCSEILGLSNITVSMSPSLTRLLVSCSCPSLALPSPLPCVIFLRALIAN